MATKDILIYSTRGCPYCIVAKRALEGRGIPYREIDITLTPHVRDELSAKTGEWTVPQIFVDGKYIGQDDELVEMVNAGELDPKGGAVSARRDEAPVRDVLVIGGGHTGLDAARMLAETGLSVAVLERAPHAPSIDPERDRRIAQAERAGVEWLEAEAFGLETGGQHPAVVTLEEPLAARAILIATGARDRNADLPGEEALSGKGVSRCAECDGAFFTGLDVAITGNDERTARAALDLAPTCRSVTLVCPDEALAANRATREQIEELANITVRTATRIAAVHGDRHVTGVDLEGPDGASSLDVSGVFFYLNGDRPAGAFAGEELADGGTIAASATGATGTPGVFAVGTVTGRNDAPPDAVAAAVEAIHEFLSA
ncbi:MAG: FAD-dependent oxidoreductase [Nitrospirota bacterium]|nr:FAD-dependent oxidoreductase [Nitrospirota bacterium]